MHDMQGACRCMRADCGEVEDSPEVGGDSVQSSALDPDITTCFFIVIFFYKHI